MALSKESQETIKELVTPIVTSTLSVALVGAAMTILSKVVVTNFKESGLTGDTELKPTDNETTISKAEVAGSEAEGKLAQDKVAGTEGEVKANETEARALTGEATAAESGASALRTKAGASDIETKALKMT
jgi:hypothetical protein